MTAPRLSVLPFTLLALTLLALTACSGPGGGRGGRGPGDGFGGGPGGGGPGGFGAASGFGAMPSISPYGLLFATMDRDGDTRTSQAELQAGLQFEWQRFVQMGGRSTGAIAFRDWAVHTLGTDAVTPSFIGLDEDGNASLDADEFRNGLARAFTHYDRNHNGLLERSELLAAQNAGRGGGMGGGPGGGMEGGGRPPQR